MIGVVEKVNVTQRRLFHSSVESSLCLLTYLLPENGETNAEPASPFHSIFQYSIYALVPSPIFTTRKQVEIQTFRLISRHILFLLFFNIFTATGMDFV